MTLAADRPTRTLLPPVVCVLGMHRSGTSLVTRIANSAGVGLGPNDQLMSPHYRDNPTGYWENAEIVSINDDLLESLGGTWDDPPVLTPGWEHAQGLELLRHRARDVVAALASEDAAVMGWKDPRMSIVLPFWATVVPISATIVVHRHPFAVAASLELRDDMDTERGAALWLRHTVGAWLAHPNRALVSYEYALIEPAATAVNIARFLGLPHPDQSDLDVISEFASVSLNRNANAAPEVGPNMTLALAVHALLETQDFATLDALFGALQNEWMLGRGPR